MSNKRKRGRPPGRRPSHIIYARVSPELGAAFERYVAETKPRPSDKAVVELALEEFLASRGFWPPATKERD